MQGLSASLQWAPLPGHPATSAQEKATLGLFFLRGHIGTTPPAQTLVEENETGAPALAASPSLGSFPSTPPVTQRIHPTSCLYSSNIRLLKALLVLTHRPVLSPSPHLPSPPPG